MDHLFSCYTGIRPVCRDTATNDARQEPDAGDAPDAPPRRDQLGIRQRSARGILPPGWKRLLRAHGPACHGFGPSLRTRSTTAMSDRPWLSLTHIHIGIHARYYYYTTQQRRRRLVIPHTVSFIYPRRTQLEISDVHTKRCRRRTSRADVIIFHEDNCGRSTNLIVLLKSVLYTRSDTGWYSRLSVALCLWLRAIFWRGFLFYYFNDEVWIRVLRIWIWSWQLFENTTFFKVLKIML